MIWCQKVLILQDLRFYEKKMIKTCNTVNVMLLKQQFEIFVFKLKSWVLIFQQKHYFYFILYFLSSEACMKLGVLVKNCQFLKFTKLWFDVKKSWFYMIWDFMGKKHMIKTCNTVNVMILKQKFENFVFKSKSLKM